MRPLHQETQVGGILGNRDREWPDTLDASCLGVDRPGVLVVPKHSAKTGRSAGRRRARRRVHGADQRDRKADTRAKVASKEKKTTKKGSKDSKKGGDGTLPAFEEGCVIGNRKSKKYHSPGGRGYAAAKFSKNAVFFKTAADAKAAGYTPVKR